MFFVFRSFVWFFFLVFVCFFLVFVLFFFFAAPRSPMNLKQFHKAVSALNCSLKKICTSQLINTPSDIIVTSSSLIESGKETVFHVIAQTRAYWSHTRARAPTASVFPTWHLLNIICTRCTSGWRLMHVHPVDFFKVLILSRVAAGSSSCMDLSNQKSCGATSGGRR